MKLVFPDGFQVEVSTEITYTQYNSIFNALKGEWSYPFQLIGSDEILSYLNYPHLPQVSAVHQRAYESVSLYKGSFLIGTGTFTIIEATAKTIVANLNSTAGNIPLKTLKQKLNTLNLGGEVIPTISKTSNYFYYGNWSAIDLRIPTNFLFHLITIKSGNDSLLTAKLIWTYGYQADDSKFKNAVATALNSVSNQDIIIEANDQRFDIKFATDKTDVRILFQYANGAAGNFNVITVILPSLSYTTIKQTHYDDKIDNAVYALPEIQNYAFYQNKMDWSGVINRQINQKVQLNDDSVQIRNSVIPQLKLSWVITRLVEILGYTYSGAFMQNPDILKLLIHNLYSTDKQSSDVKIAFNVHHEIVRYANHLPNISILDFFKALINQFGLGIDFNPLTKVVEFFFFKDILNDAPQIIDINNRVSILPKNKFEEKRKTQVSYAISGDSLAKEDVSPYTSIPTKAVVDASVENYDKLELNFPPLTTTAQGKIQIEAPAISPIFNQSKNESPLRLFFLESQEGKAETATLSLDLTKPTGVYQRFIQQKLDFESKTLTLECKTLLTLLEITSLTQKTLFLAYNVYWYWDYFSIKIKTGRNTYEVEMRLKRVEK